MSKYGTHQDAFLKQRGQLKTFVARAATVVVGVHQQLYQVCQVGFLPDGSIWIQWPYVSAKRGVVAIMERPEAPKSLTVDLAATGKFTSHKVKYTHHPDGRAHFSQDRKVYTRVKRQSFPLTGPLGKIGYTHIYNVEGFQKLEKKRTGRLYLPFVFTNPADPANVPDSFLVTAEWRRRTDILAGRKDPRATLGPMERVIERSSGRTWYTFFLAPPVGSPLRDHVMLVSCEGIPTLAGAREPTMIFLGGPDLHEVSRELAGTPIPTGYLLAMYPANSTDEVVARAGTIDL